jgi:hypothetical protein
MNGVTELDREQLKRDCADAIHVLEKLEKGVA